MSFWLLFACFIFLAFSSLLGCLESSLFFRLWLRLYRELSVTPQTPIFLSCLSSFLVLLSWSVIVCLSLLFVVFVSAVPCVVSCFHRPRPVALSFFRFLLGGPSLVDRPSAPHLPDPWARGRLTAAPLCPCGREFPAR